MHHKLALTASYTVHATRYSSRTESSDDEPIHKLVGQGDYGAKPPPRGKNARQGVACLDAALICQKTANCLGLLATVRKPQPKIPKSQPENTENAAGNVCCRKVIQILTAQVYGQQDIAVAIHHV